MNTLNFTVPCLFGLEGIVGTELKRLKMDNIQVENGRVEFSGTFSDMARANLWIRSGERVLIKLAQFKVLTFTDLFEGVKAIPWEDFIPKDGAFPVKGHSLRSQLFSVPDCQSIIKKAIVEHLKERYHVSWFQETGAKYQIQFGIQNDIAMIYLDTSGPGLHKRGYRARANDAPLRETLAASMVELARYRGRECLYDPFCGSGTIIIEAAMIAQNRAPGLFRRFDVENWQMSDPAMWKQLRADARTCTFDRDFKLIGTDTDSHSLAIARENAVKAGVSQYVKFEQADARQFLPQSDSGVLITNPPYGERMLDVSEAEELYKGFGAAMRKYPDFHTYVISSHQDFERFYGKKATKRRKLYNGMIKCEYYMYY